jgi:predicted dehydrogenase
MKDKVLNLGIIGTGAIASTMAQTVNQMDEVNLYAVASRTEKKASDFATQYGAEKYYASYAKLAEDDNIDLVYIATPHSEHYENMKLCIENGRNVLCEKAFTINAKQAKEIAELAKKKDVFLSEAMWTRYQPLANKLKELIDSNSIGHITMISSNMHFPMMGKERLWNPRLAGGALLDVGIYPLTISSMVMGDDIEEIVAKGKITDLKMDESAAAIVRYKNGKIATATWGMSAISDCRAAIYGSGGILVVTGVNRIHTIEQYDTEWNCVSKYTADESEITGYEFEVRACREAILNGKKETDVMPVEKTVFMMELMDDIRQQLGVEYPMENN